MPIGDALNPHDFSVFERDEMTSSKRGKEEDRLTGSAKAKASGKSSGEIAEGSDSMARCLKASGELRSVSS